MVVRESHPLAGYASVARAGRALRAMACIGCLTGPLTAAADETGSAATDLEEPALYVAEPKENLARRFELSLLGAAQVNGTFTNHLGLTAEAIYHLSDGVALYAGAFYNPYARESGFADRLLSSASLAPRTSNRLLVRWEAGAGVEVSPVYGKFTWGGGGITRFALFARAGAGAADTRVWLAPSGAGPGPLFGDAGVRLTGSLGLGARLGLSDRIGLRLEVRDEIFSSRLSRVNGCDLADLDALASAQGAAQVKSGCDAAAFARDGYATAGPAADSVRSSSPGVVNNLAALVGVSFLF